jgi:hypothetical protein
MVRTRGHLLGNGPRHRGLLGRPPAALGLAPLTRPASDHPPPLDSTMRRHECLSCGHQWDGPDAYYCPACGRHSIRSGSGEYVRTVYSGEAAKPR